MTKRKHLVEHTKTHPHGFMWYSSRHDIAFVRISKCGSSTFISAIEANEILPFAESGQCGQLLCAIRNPLNRFLSSIPETIKRIYHVYEKDDDVLVNDEIISFLKNRPMTSAHSILAAFIEAINEFGFFDAHHEPMTRFLVDSTGEAICNPMLFPLEAMDQVLSDIVGVIPERKNSRSENKMINRAKSFVKRFVVVKTKNREAFHARRDSLLHKFHQEFSGDLRDLYQALIGLRKEEALQEFITRMYRADSHLYEALFRNEFSTHDFFGLYEGEIKKAFIETEIMLMNLRATETPTFSSESGLNIDE